MSPTVNGRLEEEWETPNDFRPERFLHTREDGTVEVTEGEQLTKGGKFKWVPFGSGRHRCIGFDFAQLQIRCVWSQVLRLYELELPNGLSGVDALCRPPSCLALVLLVALSLLFLSFASIGACPNN